ncbi:MAG: hypothetical protein QM734_03700 [Cyclobacteriaceae bacterium]
MDNINFQEEKTPEWLDKLQQESWQAEILISGGALVGVITALDYLPSFYNLIEFSTKIGNSSWPFGITSILLIFLAEGFIIHLLSRAYWIGMIAVSSAFPQGVNGEKLAMKGSFKNLIRINSNTPFLIKLDKFCGLVFAFTFFIIFAVLGLLLWVYLAIRITKLVGLDDKSVLFFFLLGLGLLSFLDFFTFGRIKRLHWFSKIYFPIHFIFSIITFSFFYRRLYYTIVSNVRSSYIILFFVLQILLFVFLIGIWSAEFPPLAGTWNSSGENSFLSLKETVITGKSLQLSVNNIPNIQNESFEEWKKKEQKQNRVH